MMATEPPEAASIKSMLHIARILALIFAIIFLFAGIGVVVALVAIGAGVFAGFAAFFLIGVVIDIVIYVQLKEIAAMVDRRQYEAAKSKTLVWMIIGFILGGIIIGILVLVAWLKFDPLITWQRTQMQGGAPPAGYAPAYAPPPMAPPMAAAPPPGAPPAAAAPAAPFCAKCGKPTTYIPQYGRYYCYTDNLYV
jgi:hypothetical protein